MRVIDAVLDFYNREIIPRIINKNVSSVEGERLLELIYYYFKELGITKDDIEQLIRELSDLEYELLDNAIGIYLRVLEDVMNEVRPRLVKIMDKNNYICIECPSEPYRIYIFPFPCDRKRKKDTIYGELLGLVNLFIRAPRLLEAVLDSDVPNELKEKARRLLNFFNRTVQEKHVRDRTFFAVKT